MTVVSTDYQEGLPKKALFIELVSSFYCIYFLLLLVIWLFVENMFSTEPIVAFLDLFMLYILVAFVSY